MLTLTSPASTRDRSRLQRRVLAFAGLFLLLSGLLAALSLIVVVLAAFALVLLLALAFGSLWLLGRARDRFPSREVLVSTTRPPSGAIRWLRRRLGGAAARRHALRSRIRPRETAAVALPRMERLLARGLKAYATIVYRLTTRRHQADTRAATEATAGRPTPPGDRAQ